MTENTGNKYEEYNGKLLDLIPRLRFEGRQPISIAGVMRGRLEGISSLEETVDTCDAIAIHPSGKRKLLLSPTLLLNVTPQSKLSFGALPLTEKEYANLPGYEFTEQEFREFGSPREYPFGISTNPLWKAVVPDHELLKKYAEHVSRLFSFLRAAEDPSTYMGVYAGSPQRGTSIGSKSRPILIPLSLHDIAHRSYLAPSPFLDKECAHVIVYSETISLERSKMNNWPSNVSPPIKRDSYLPGLYVWSGNSREIVRVGGINND